MSSLPNYQLVRSHRRSLAIHISPNGDVIVKAPVFVPSFLIKRFVMDKSDWIERRLAHLQTLPSIKKRRYVEGEEYMYMGRKYILRFGNFKEITVTNTLNFPQFLSFRIEKELAEWYVRQAKVLISERVEYYSNHMGADFQTISFSDTSSKWGSCSHDNKLQFNWRLIMAPITVIDYVVVHELAHTFEHNHGRAFWRKVEIYKPAYKQYVKWLRDHGHILFQ